MTETTSGIRITTRADDRAAREVRSLDDALEDLERTGRSLRLPDDQVDRLERELRDAGDALDDAGQATGGLGEQLQGLAGPAAIAAAGIAAIGTALVLAVRQSAEFQREIFQTAESTGTAADEIEGLARTFLAYGLDVERTSDAVRDFYERLGEARTLPDSGIGEAFRDAGFDINAAGADLTGFLSSVADLESRAQQLYVIRTILTGDSEELLVALTDANFQARLDANVLVALDAADRARILEADRALTDVSNEISRLVDKLVVSIGPAIVDAVSNTERAIRLLEAAGGGVGDFVGGFIEDVGEFFANPGQFLQRNTGAEFQFLGRDPSASFVPPPAVAADQPLSEGARLAIMALETGLSGVIASVNVQLELLEADSVFERQRIQIGQNAEAQIASLQAQRMAAEQLTALTAEQEASYGRALVAVRQLEQAQLDAIAVARPGAEITGGGLDLDPVLEGFEDAITGSFDDISDLAATRLDVIRANLGETLGDLDALSLRAGQGLRTLRDGLSLLGVEAPREFQQLESALFGVLDISRGIATGDAFSVVAGSVSLLAGAIGLVAGSSDDAARSQIEYARALQEIARQADQITDAVLSGSTQLEGLRLASTEAFRTVIDAPSLDPGELRERIETLIGDFASANINTVGDLATALNAQGVALGDSLGGLFEALGVSIADAPSLTDFDPSELDAAQREFLEPIRAFAEQLAAAFGETSGIGEVIQAALTLDSAMEDLTATIRTLTGAEEAQIRETFNLERINIRAQAQTAFTGAGADPFEQARIFQQLEGELAAITAAENAALESARAITTGALPGLGGGAPSLPPTEDQTDEIENYLTRIEELTGRVQQLDLTSEQGLEQFFELAREFRGIFFDAVATFDELPPVLEVALNAANTVFAVAGQAAALAYREGVAGGIALLEPEVVDSQAIIEIRPSPLGDGTWDIFFIGGPDGIMLPPELGVDSSRILEIGLLQELDQWNKLFVGGGGDRVLPEGLTADSARVFRIDGVQNIDQWQVIYAAATGADVLPVTLFSNSARVFQIDSLQDLQNWAAIYAQPGDDFLPITVFDGSGRVFQIDSLQAFNSWADLYEGAAEDVLPAPLSAGSERVFQIGELQRLDSWLAQSMAQRLVGLLM